MIRVVRRLALPLIIITVNVCVSVFTQTPPISQLTDEVTLRLIVTSSEDEALRVIEQLKNGADFIALAHTLSIDPTADRGGLIGTIALSSLRAELRDALQRVGIGEITEAIPVPSGFAILKKVPDADAGRDGGSASAAVTAIGAVKYSFNVSGVVEADASLNQFSKPADWNQDPRMICQMRTQSLALMQQSLEDDLSSANPTSALAPPSDLLQAHFMLGQFHAYQGSMERAIQEFQKARDIAASSAPALRLQMEEALGIAYLHKSAIANDVFHKPGERCLLTLNGVEPFVKRDDSLKAVEYFLKYLAEKPDELEVKWLLNFAYMTLGAHPDKVPPAHLIPPSVFSSVEDIGRFVDVAPQAGLNSFGSAGGVIVDDFDNDGRFDVVTSSLNSCDPMHFFRRNEDGGFTEQASKAGLGDQVGGLNILQTDFNNDGCLDILVLRGAWGGPERKSLLRNNCNGTFTDVTAASGLARPATSTQAAVWADINNDGLLDLFVANESSPAQLFLNKGDGAFEDIARAAGVDRTAFSKGVAAGDYDNDGWADIYVSNLGGAGFLYHNNHDGTFTERARAAGADGPGRGFVTWFFDYDNDGWQDLFVASYFQSLTESARTYLRLPHNATTLKLYKNLRDGRFADVTQQVGLDKVFMPMGANFGDIDNDGFLDMYLGTGNPSYASLVPSVLLRNRGGTSFVDVTTSSGTGEWHKGHGVAFADLDNDGDEDIVFEVGGATPGDAHALRLFKNPGHRNDWINLRLVGAKTNRAAVGVRIKVTVENAGVGTRVIHRVIGSGGSFGASPMQQHIGLGKDARILDLEVWWPTSNTRQRFANPDSNQWLEIRELAETHTKLERPRLPLGSGNP